MKVTALEALLLFAIIFFLLGLIISVTIGMSTAYLVTVLVVAVLMIIFFGNRTAKS
jgi:hypothetical protein